jgi:predicted TIM-barrel fold metal-dependent hydrolase
MFKRQCYLVGWYDRSSLQTRHFIGNENILWSTNFPLANSTWPASRETIQISFDGVSEEDRRKILWENAAHLYRIS